MGIKNAWVAVVVAAVVLATYSAWFVGFATDYGLFRDDLWYLVHNRTIESVLAPGWTASELRPVAGLLFFIANQLGDFNRWGHTINAIVNGLAVLFSLAVLLDVASRYNPRTLPRRDWVFIFCLLLSQLIHLSTTFNLLWVSGVQTLFGGMVYALMLLATLRYQRSQDWRWLGVVAASSLLGLFSYEAVLGAILVVPVLFWYFERRHPVQRAKYLLGCVALPLSVYLAARALFAPQTFPWQSSAKECWFTLPSISSLW
ncbi:MAG: hypothetical protein HY675_06560 [Chloroflexi bacterium]|nr:hypothetical protein [Chloroflexota bacterium]